MKNKYIKTGFLGELGDLRREKECPVVTRREVTHPRIFLYKVGESNDY